jgi:hypothetical protein
MLNNVTGNGIELAADPPYELKFPFCSFVTYI